MKNIYIVISRFKKREDFTSINISSECYDTREKAIKFCKERFSKEDNEYIEKLQKRGLVNWYEFNTINSIYSYEIQVLNLKEENK